MTIKKEVADEKRFQNTLAKSVSYQGIGLHTGVKVTMHLHPASENTGIVFRRIDLDLQPSLKAHINHVVSTPRCTNIGCNAFSIYTVEHLLSALKAFGIDNVFVDLDGPEPPVGDGSALLFVELIKKAGLLVQKQKKTIRFLKSPISYSSGNTHLVALPCENYKISYTLHYPNCSTMGTQFYSFDLSSSGFEQEIAPCRTFALYEEVAKLKEKGLIKGGSLDNAVVIKNDQVVNEEGLRFSEEMARHKILDVIGDLALLSLDFRAHVIALCSGHSANIAFGKKILEYFAK